MVVGPTVIVAGIFQPAAAGEKLCKRTVKVDFFVLQLPEDDLIDPALPLIDLHRHLDGNVRLETIIDLARQHDIHLPAGDVEGLRPHVQVMVPQPGIMAFIGKFRYLMEVLADYDACRRVAYENVEDACLEGIDYVELRFSPHFMALPHGLHHSGVVEAVIDGAGAGARDFDIGVNLIGIMSRTYGLESTTVELEALLEHREHITALDLAGDEVRFPGELFVEHFRRARDAGWHVTVHAGEEGGAGSIWQAIRELGATRIGHAINATEDPVLMDYMVEHGVGIEANLTSNVQTSCVEDFAVHPLRRFLDRGLWATINTDDPVISNITLPHEYRVAAPKAGLTREHTHRAQRNSLRIAFLSSEEKKALQAKKSTRKSWKEGE